MLRFVACGVLATVLLGFRPVSTSLVDELPNVAIRGYDAVAYFTDGRAVRGRPVLHVEWEGAIWFFASQAHRRAFLADPEKFAPSYGGFCAYCVGESGEAVTGGDPEVFLVHKGRLYLLQSEEVRKKWLEDIDAHTEKAAEAYATLREAMRPGQS